MTTNLGNKCKKIRRDILQASFDANACHIGSSLSCVEILVALYYDILKSKDVFLFSKASGVATLYCILKDKGIIKKKVSDVLKEYPLPNKEVPGVISSMGSLGHGLPLAVGLALADRNRKVYCLMSDGEMNEGSTWEAILFAGHHKLKNLTIIIDNNGLQACGKTKDILNLGDLYDKFDVFNWNPKDVDGHNLEDIKEALECFSYKPKAIIAKTIKGKGVSFIEGRYEWHYKNLDTEDLQIALTEI